MMMMIVMLMVFMVLMELTSALMMTDIAHLAMIVSASWIVLL